MEESFNIEKTVFFLTFSIKIRYDNHILFFYLFYMTWKNAFHRAVSKELQPMRQATHWLMFIACAGVYAVKTVEASANISYQYIAANPEIAQYSWLVNGAFF